MNIVVDIHKWSCSQDEETHLQQHQCMVL